MLKKGLVAAVMASLCRTAFPLRSLSPADNMLDVSMMAAVCARMQSTPAVLVSLITPTTLATCSLQMTLIASYVHQCICTSEHSRDPLESCSRPASTEDKTIRFQTPSACFSMPSVVIFPVLAK